DPRAIPALAAALRGRQPAARMAAARALEAAHHPLADAELRKALPATDPAVAAGAYVFYIRQGVPGTEPLLIDALRVNDDPLMPRIYAGCGHAPLRAAALPLLGAAPALPDPCPRWGEARSAAPPAGK
ncbi:MAG TPA: hypothetical protein PK794_08035, partial [Armatimonadota bacterium]|nr:hypothetical protein [Armatimonadota bacterium]